LKSGRYVLNVCDESTKELGRICPLNEIIMGIITPSRRVCLKPCIDKSVIPQSNGTIWKHDYLEDVASYKKWKVY